jgi:hypothetical protein
MNACAGLKGQGRTDERTAIVRMVYCVFSRVRTHCAWLVEKLRFCPAENVISSQVGRLLDFAGMLEAGSFTYPFRFQLPSDAPGTFHLARSGSGIASITYHLRARIYLQALLARDPRHKTEFSVISRIGHVAPMVRVLLSPV